MFVMLNILSLVLMCLCFILASYGFGLLCVWGYHESYRVWAMTVWRILALLPLFLPLFLFVYIMAVVLGFLPYP